MHWLKKFTGSRTFLVALYSALSTALSAVNGVITARALLAEGRGFLAVAVSAAGLIVLISALGSNVAIRRLLPGGSVGGARSYVCLSAWLALLAGVGGLGFGLWFNETLLADPLGVGFTLSFVVLVVGYFVSNQSLDLLNATGMVLQSSRINTSGTFFCLIGLVIIAVLGGGLIEVMLAYAASFWFQGAIATYFILSRKLLAWGSEPVLAESKVILGTGFKLLGLNLGQSVTYRADSILLGFLASGAQAGIYAVATTPAAILRIPSNAMGQLAFHDRAAGRLSVPAAIRKTVLLLLALVPLALVLALSSDWLIVTLFGEPFSDAGEVFRILLIAELALAPFLLLSRALAGRGFIHAGSISGVTGAVTLVALSFLLIPGLGAIGAAWASVCAYSAMSLLSLVFMLRAAD